MSIIKFGSDIKPGSLTSVVNVGIRRHAEHEKARAGREERGHGRLYASDSAACWRQGVMSSTDQDKREEKSSNIVYYRLGNEIEAIIMDALYAQGILMFKQYRLPDVGINLGGYIDGIVFSGSRVRVLEVKSCGELPNSPRLSHKAQASIYSVITGFPATLLYFSRHVASFDGTLKMVEFDLDKELEDPKMYLLQAVYSSICIREKVMPDIPSHITKKSQCGLCQYTSVCFDGATFKSDFEPITPAQHKNILAESYEFVKDVASPEKTKKRRNGILKHLLEHGSPECVSILGSKSWDKI